jgi:hypothetical protein
MNDQMLQNSIKYFINYLPHAMATVFVAAAFLRWAIYYTVRRHEWFARQFEAKVLKYMDSEANKTLKDASFYVLAKKIFEKSFYEAFAVRDRKSSENYGQVMSMNDRVFLVKQGCAWMVKDILKQLRYLKWSKETPKLSQITRATLHHNPCFTKLFGVIPMGAMNELLTILPGLFVVAGIFFRYQRRTGFTWWYGLKRRRRHKINYG